MSSSLRVALLSTALTCTFGCSFFSLDTDDLKLPPRTPAAGKAGEAAAGASTMGGNGGMPVTSEGGTAGQVPSTGGSSAAGTGGTGGSAGGDTSAGAGGSTGGTPAMGGMSGDATAGGMSGSAQAGTAGGSSGGSGGAGSCASLNAMAQSFAGHCYLLVTMQASWDDAKSACAGMNGAHLVTISDDTPDAFDAEDMFVYTLSQMQDTWLGITDGKMPTETGNGSPYTWITGEPNPPGDAWQSGEPNNYNKPCKNGDSCYEHCGFMVAGAGDKWNDDLCEATKQYVCEWDMGG